MSSVLGALNEGSAGRAAPGTNQTLGSKPLEGFAYGRAGNIELAGQLRFGR